MVIGLRLAGAAIAAALTLSGLPGTLRAERLTREVALDALTELYAAYYINERCNFVNIAGEAFADDVEHRLIEKAKLSPVDIDPVYLEARRIASVGPCDLSQRQRVERIYDRLRTRFGAPAGRRAHPARTGSDE